MRGTNCEDCEVGAAGILAAAQRKKPACLLTSLHSGWTPAKQCARPAAAGARMRRGPAASKMRTAASAWSAHPEVRTHWVECSLAAITSCRCICRSLQ